MNTLMPEIVRRLYHILLEFGFWHTMRRIKNWHCAKLDDFRRNRNHSRISRQIGSSFCTIDCIGKMLVISMRDKGLHRDLLLDRLREPVATSFLMARAKPNDIFVDLGANIGYYSLLLSDTCKLVHSIEPDPDNYASLLGNVKLNGAHNIVCSKLAISDSTEKLQLFQSHKRNWHRTIKASASDSNNLIQAISLDEYCAQADIIPTILKMDVEGFERYILKGCTRALRTIRCLFIELHGTMLSLDEINSILKTIEEAGLHIAKIIQYDRPGLWIEHKRDQIERIKRGDYGIYELIYIRE